MSVNDKVNKIISFMNDKDQFSAFMNDLEMEYDRFALHFYLDHFIEDSMCSLEEPSKETISQND